MLVDGILSVYCQPKEEGKSGDVPAGSMVVVRGSYENCPYFIGDGEYCELARRRCRDAFEAELIGSKYVH